jgi:hypothetical protein
MDRAYDDVTRANGEAGGEAVLFGSALVLVLIGVQAWFLMRMRRILNPSLAVATVLACALTVYLTSLVGEAREHLRIAKQDAFESIHVLLRARSIAFDANGDESRYLLDRSAAPLRVLDDESSFAKNVRVLATDPNELVKRASGFGSAGLFVDELTNVTFPGEGEAAKKMVGAFNAYLAIDRKIRNLETSGKHSEAIELCIGSRPDQSNATFARFDAALEETATINRQAFDREIDDADGKLKRAEYLSPILSIALVLLAFVGIRRRLAEYAG